MAARKRRPTSTYKRKIVSREELRNIIGPPPRKEPVVMCHGTFDIVHPGHIRHLLYAKERGAILVASLTTDQHVTKADHRPYFPEELRAMNLAAIEAVDYVIIDRNPTPLENLAYVQPDFFVKGFEYSKEGIHPKTQEEMKVLESFGGEIIFTPGDVVYSSSRIIESVPPKLHIEKLGALMESEQLTFGDLRNAFSKFEDVKVHVVGDTIVDSYTYCTVIGASNKTPTLSTKYERAVHFVGGAACVAKHLKTAGAQVRFSTVMGDDPLKEFVLKNLIEHGVQCFPVIDRTRPTTDKNYFICNGYHVLKVDTLDNRTIGDRVVDQLTHALESSDADTFVFSDFRHGIFTKTTIPGFVSALPRGAFKVADSQVASRWGNILDFNDFDLITPNEKEARFALGDQDSVVRPLGQSLYERAKCKVLIMKLGERGILTYRSAEQDYRNFFVVDSFADKVVDAVGSGDAMLAYSTLALKSTGSPVIASILGTFAAAAACENEGNVPVSPEDLETKIAQVERSLGGA